ncbi:hypothetical protein ATANTOWER_005811 [Ataeniobius toweri]|uniref:Uncharacterized protein n=1 Tax=Ataeniobius toweri TaxID=208326 RepID=A0ABU7B1P3_9TELE|nr:hypothetical protein [Ataeniobius toweri]
MARRQSNLKDLDLTKDKLFKGNAENKKTRPILKKQSASSQETSSLPVPLPHLRGTKFTGSVNCTAHLIVTKNPLQPPTAGPLPLQEQPLLRQ